MANAVNAMLKGHDYQALIFWIHACKLLQPNTGVVKVAYELDNPKAFDDVVVWYDPPIPLFAPDRVRVRFIQSKFKVSYDQSFGFSDLSDPSFIGATSYSLLHRLRDAQQREAPDGKGVRFVLWSLARLHTEDPLHKFVHGADRSFRIDDLLDGTTDQSATGKIRKIWREHLGLVRDEDLRPILYPLEIRDNALSFEDLKDHLSLVVNEVGLEPIDHTISGVHYCSVIHNLNERGLNVFDCDSFKQVCNEEKLFAKRPIARQRDVTRVSIRSFFNPGIDPAVGHDKLLLLTKHYKARYLTKDDDWRLAIQPEVTEFLSSVAAEGMPIELSLDAHASIAFLSGHILHPKLGLQVDLIQKSAGQGKAAWNSVGEVPAGAPDLKFSEEAVGTGSDIALCIGISQDPLPAVRTHVAANLPGVGHILSGLPTTGLSHTAVKNGPHAARLADAVANELAKLRSRVGWSGRLHLFLAVPNGLSFLIGQRSRGFGPITLYEFDFERRDRGYLPSMTLNEDVT